MRNRDLLETNEAPALDLYICYGNRNLKSTGKYDGE
ncbi:hypothetical protein SLEP1_g13673 [Rubroshorea leprosula]|uniref:Uncharacterized protein n=1 Tax=Rubroshorea leprosula TaxID=152421 RepID=A0AAV5IMF5_9ROSI|nr:hypothetical protein SLEP1_g13673 [Rubroshorea leprosula]